MKTLPSISIVIPCFNDGQFLKDCLRSVFQQTLQPFEIIVIDDGSTEPKTVRLFRQINASAVKIIHQENRGLAGARNTGIRNARGQYVYFLDSDDLIVPECLAKLSDLLEEQSVGIAAVSRIHLFGGPHDGTVWGQPVNPYIIRVQNQWGAGIMLRRDAIFQNELWYDESMRSGYEDWELHIRLVKSGKKILFCPDPLYRYRIRKKSLLSTTRRRHSEVLNYILSKHGEDYTLHNLLNAKRAHAPALLIDCDDSKKAGLEDWLETQTFRDWSLGKSSSAQGGRYRLFYPNLDALHRLPPEALECALMALECYRLPRHCVLAVRRGCLSLFASANRTSPFANHRYPAALVAREDVGGRRIFPKEALGECELLIEFIDQNPSSTSSWEQSSVRFSPNSLMAGFRGPESVRKSLRAVGRRILGENFQRGCIQLYDHVYYKVLCSDEAITVRSKIRSAVGPRVEHALSSLVYGFFLSQPPDEETRRSTKDIHPLPEKLSPFFVSRADGRIHILIATAWLIEGGVEQIIFELCRLLVPSRFRVTIVTTLPSHHAWDRLARDSGASVYHLADFLKPADMVKGFLHFVLNHHVDCIFIMNSEIAYRAAKTLKRVTPWMPIIDRIEAPDPGGGYPMISAKVGRQFIDLRTVSHRKLAKYMSAKYRLPLDSIKVIYIGAHIKRIDDAANRYRGLLHEQCSVTPDTPIVLFVGRFASQKRPEVFVRSVGKIFAIDPSCQAHFALVGDGHLMQSVTSLISELGLGQRIHLLGARANALDLMRHATILMMPSAYEGLALVSYEAMALGIPQIFANVGGQRELITPETGILINNGRGEETRYARACLELLADPERRARMAAAGKERIRSYFTAESAVKQYAGIFEEAAILSRKRAAEIPHLRPPHVNPLHDLA